MRRPILATWLPVVACILAGPRVVGRIGPATPEGTASRAQQPAESRTGGSSVPVKIGQAPAEARVSVKRQSDLNDGAIPAAGPSGPASAAIVSAGLTANSPSAPPSLSQLPYFPTGPPARS